MNGVLEMFSVRYQVESVELYTLLDIERLTHLILGALYVVKHLTAASFAWKANSL